MNQELENKLLTSFPNLYKQYHLPMTLTCMCWGFNCDKRITMKDHQGYFHGNKMLHM